MDNRIKLQKLFKSLIGAKKGLIGNVKLLNRTTDPQTIYAREDLHRDDIVDITDFDYVSYIAFLSVPTALFLANLTISPKSA